MYNYSESYSGAWNPYPTTDYGDGATDPESRKQVLKNAFLEICAGDLAENPSPHENPSVPVTSSLGYSHGTAAAPYDWNPFANPRAAAASANALPWAGFSSNAYGPAPVPGVPGVMSYAPWAQWSFPEWMVREAPAPQKTARTKRGGRAGHTGGKGQHRSSQGMSAMTEEQWTSRTTMMLRNIPNKYTQRMMLRELDDRGFKGDYDFFYLPIDFRNRCNVGYAFVNFKTPEIAERFKVDFHGKRLPAYNSTKVSEVCYAKVQGLKANVENYRNSSVFGIPVPQYWPLLFEDGVEVPFPSPDAPLPPIQLRPPRS